MYSMKSITEAQQHLDEIEANPSSLYGVEIGTEKLVREGMTFRMFVRHPIATASGKAQLVSLSVFVKIDGKDGFRVLSGATYIPNFAIQDVYWILKNKIYNKLCHPSEMGIDQKYVKKTGMNMEINVHDIMTPEQHGEEHISWLRGFMAEKYPLVLA